MVGGSGLYQEQSPPSHFPKLDLCWANCRSRALCWTPLLCASCLLSRGHIKSVVQVFGSQRSLLRKLVTFDLILRALTSTSHEPLKSCHMLYTHTHRCYNTKQCNSSSPCVSAVDRILGTFEANSLSLSLLCVRHCGRAAALCD